MNMYSTGLFYITVSIRIYCKKVKNYLFYLDYVYLFGVN